MGFEIDNTFALYFSRREAIAHNARAILAANATAITFFGLPFLVRGVFDRGSGAGAVIIVATLLRLNFEITNRAQSREKSSE